MTTDNIGEQLYKLCEKMFPICRSITGNGVRQTLEILKEVVPDITVHEVPSGTQVFDWTVPKEWNIKDAWIKDEKGNKILDFNKCNLSVLGYSLPLDKYLSKDELLQLIYTQPSQKDVIPYVTSYYKERSGFCMRQVQKDQIQNSKDQKYHAFIDSTLENGSLTYGELILEGQSKKEILISTYICHPSMANNELSGPSVSVHLAKYLLSLPNRHYTYRFVYIPETIGSITYLSQKNHLQVMKQNTIAGFNLSCIGDDRTYTYVETRYGNTLSDKVAQNVLKFIDQNYQHRSYHYRGSDERQYNAPGIDLPVACLCRSKFGEYPEYHTNKDDLTLISPKGLEGGFEMVLQCIQALETNFKYQVTCLGEPQLGKRGLYPTLSQKGSYDGILAMRDLIAYADGTNDLIDISNLINVPIKTLIPIVKKLTDSQLLKLVEE